ncbi:hypothetical protein C7U92_20435 [Bradyrhizobium sp. WBOS7]|uniref:Uncharacterized protein n=1 Tax=Bradyrhizobium betae TaxID=244734 RepID=A0AAE9N7Y3_9BRAD|nr:MULTISPECIES: hypothetical protein [Bradyrhizobium]MDD1572963.1 hypothetical protein [Bradyrhizobium sp. WBOS1]UUO33173.1 hypothetical protein DCK84_00330 [Bradyrhizobium sp. WBOS01]MDD1529430.1 hypothetical protein [Bradyrhizobium sp. WBOS2]MDD1579064.1 hypothetical protein [Bradyrhizobium sp. WBOS7]MDD1601871.1 hypothetical protein [Bradyrhizobium sp. WBOS16]
MSIIKIAIRMAAAAALAATITTAASAAVYPPQRQLPATVISDFKASPNSLLQQYPTGGPQLISRVRDLGASDPTTLPGLIALLKDPATTKDQMQGIVAGLAQVARMAAQSDQAYANEIQSAIAGTGNQDVIAAYQAATGDVAIAATGGAGGGGTGAGGPTGNGFPTGGGGSTLIRFGNNTTNNNAPNTGSGGVGGTTSSVSPRR